MPITSVKLTEIQKQEALSLINSAQRISSLLASNVTNTDASFGEVFTIVTDLTNAVSAIQTAFETEGIDTEALKAFIDAIEANKDALGALTIDTITGLRDELTAITDSVDAIGIEITAITSKLNTISSANPNQEGSLAKVLKDAKDYADSVVVDSVDPSLSSSLGTDAQWALT